MLETQPTWYTPAIGTLGWHIGLWNLIGAIGFTLCGALGFASSYEPCEVALTWSTFIGSWAFLVSSLEILYFPYPYLPHHRQFKKLLLCFASLAASLQEAGPCDAGLPSNMVGDSLHTGNGA